MRVLPCLSFAYEEDNLLEYVNTYYTYQSISACLTITISAHPCTSQQDPRQPRYNPVTHKSLFVFGFEHSLAYYAGFTSIPAHPRTQ